MGCGLRVTGYGLRVTGCGLRVAGCGLRVSSLVVRESWLDDGVLNFEFLVLSCGAAARG